MTGQPHRPGPISRVVAANMRRTREAAGLSQAALAARLGWSQNVVAKLENAKTNMRVEQLVELHAALELDCHELLNGTEDLVTVHGPRPDYDPGREP